MELVFKVSVDPESIRVLLRELNSLIPSATPPMFTREAVPAAGKCVACGDTGVSSKGEPCVCQPKPEEAPAPKKGRPKKEAAAPEATPSAPPLLKEVDRAVLIVTLQAYKNKNGKDAVTALLVKHGGQTVEGKTALVSVPAKNWPALYTEAKAGA